MKSSLLVYLALDREDFRKHRLRRYVVEKNSKVSLEYLSATLEAEGIACQIIDQSINNFSLGQLISKINAERFMFVGFYAHIFVSDKLFKCLSRIRQDCDVKLIVGGPAFVEAEKLVACGCDIVCHGEGERTVTQIVNYLEGRIPIEEIGGISYRKNGAIQTNKPQELIMDLDRIPFPDRNKIPLKDYGDYYIPTLRRPYTTMIASRGCPYRCIYCFSPCWWQGAYRTRSVDNVIQEVDSLVEQHKIRYIVFRDDVFGARFDWLSEFCQALIARNYDLGWMCNFYPRAFSDRIEEALGLMQRAGCNFIHLGTPSANREILRKINRPQNEPLVMEKISKVAKRKGMIVLMEFILGLPGETAETIQENLKFAFRLKPHFVNFHPLGVEPSTELQRRYRNQKICDFSHAEIEAHCINAMRKFYLNFGNLYRIASKVLTKNPFWIKNLTFLQ